MTNTISEQEERAIALSLRAQGGADRGVSIHQQATSRRAQERAKRLAAPRLSPEILRHYQSPLEREWLW